MKPLRKLKILTYPPSGEFTARFRVVPKVTFQVPSLLKQARAPEIENPTI